MSKEFMMILKYSLSIVYGFIIGVILNIILPLSIFYIPYYGYKLYKKIRYTIQKEIDFSPS